MKSLVIIPAYNEEKSIEKTVQDIQENAPEFDYVIVNDCSKDATLEVCREKGMHVLNLPVNLGIGTFQGVLGSNIGGDERIHGAYKRFSRRGTCFPTAAGTAHTVTDDG